MSPKEEKIKGTIIEPIFEGITPGVTAAPLGVVEKAMLAFAPTIPPEAVPAQPAMMPEAIKSAMVALAAPTTKHHEELSMELSYYNERSQSLFFRLFYDTFANTGISPILTVEGVWEVGEDADYKVSVSNYTYFDLKNIKLILYITPNGQASIKSPPGSYLTVGDIDYADSKSVTFKLHAEKAGLVTLNLVMIGRIDPLRHALQYGGYYWNGSIWTYKPAYKNKFLIYG